MIYIVLVRYYPFTLTIHALCLGHKLLLEELGLHQGWEHFLGLEGLEGINSENVRSQVSL